MKFSPQDYIDGAKERVQAADVMRREGRYVEALYLAGVAVECVLRAYTKDDSGEFDGRHDLLKLSKAATLERFVGERQRQRISAALAEVWVRWRNNYRYTSQSRLLVEMRRLPQSRGIQGDLLKEHARISVESAFVIVNKGGVQWKKR